jgi:hypothetical protein
MYGEACQEVLDEVLSQRVLNQDDLKVALRITIALITKNK